MYRSVVVTSIILGLVVLCAGYAQAADSARNYVSGNFFLVLDNTKCGFVKSVDGGAISAEVISEPPGATYFVKKHIGQPKYEEFTAQIGLSMSKGIYEWIAQSWAMNPQRKNGSVVALDYALKPKSERQFSQALITETTIPACDGSSKEPAYITVKFAPEFIRSVTPDASATYGEGGSGPRGEQKMWLPSNFRLTIDGLDCSKVSKVDSFTVKQSVVTDDIGEARDQVKEPGKLEFPNLTITMSEASAQTWIDWHKDFVIEGNNDEDKEKDGTLVFLDPSRQKELLRINLFNLGIFKIDYCKSEANADQIKRVAATLYCERMELEYLGGLISSGSGSTTSTGTSSTNTEPANTAGSAQQPTEDCQLGVNYSVGVDNPINLTVNRIEYTAERRKVGKEYRRPEIGEKMVVVHYTLQNPTKSDIPVGSARIDWTLTDSSNVNHVRDRYAGVEESGAVLDSSLTPSQSINCFACFRMPAKGQAVRLIAASHGETKGEAVYRLEGKVDPLPDLYVETGDETGSTRRPVVSGKMGESYQVLDQDIKVESIEYTEQPILDWKLPTGQKYLLLTVEYKNFTEGTYPVSGGNIEVADMDGVAHVSKGSLAVSSLRAVTLKPESEVAVRLRTVYQVPKDMELQSINIKNSSKTATMVRIDQTAAAPARRRVAS